MTMLDGKCDICHIGEAIGVASTSTPYSWAFCRRCAEMCADPEIVFETIYGDFEPDKVRDDLLTFKNGRYMNYKEWFELRKQSAME